MKWLVPFLFMSSLCYAEECVDTALVLMSDISNSVEPLEKEAQRRGYRDAFASEAVWKQIQMGGYCSGILVKYAEFSEIVVPVTDWVYINSQQDAVEFGQLIYHMAPLQEQEYKKELGMTTATGDAILVANVWLDELGEGLWNRVIDVSSDGVTNKGTPIKGVQAVVNPPDQPDRTQINGLPLMYGTNEPDKLKEEFELFIRSKSGFIEYVNKPEDFTSSLITKLVKEIF